MPEVAPSTLSAGRDRRLILRDVLMDEELDFVHVRIGASRVLAAGLIARPSLSKR